MDQAFGELSDCIDEQCSSFINFLDIDPLEDFDIEDILATEPKFYKTNSVVFAEPLNNTTNEEKSTKEAEDKDELKVLDNVIVQKVPGKKYKKYYFNIEDDGPASCSQLNCHRTFSSKNRLIAHIRRVHCADRKKHICEHCGRGFPEKHLLIRHASTHSEETVKCPVCGLKLRVRTSLQAHLRSHSDEQQHVCEICKKTFSRAASKTLHIKFVHKQGSLECDKCDKRFSSRKQWKLHMKTHEEKTPS